MTLNSDIRFKPANHIQDETQGQSIDDNYPTSSLHEPGAETHVNSTVRDLPKPVFPKRTSVTRCCDLLASIKNLVHECTSVPALNNLEKVLASALKDLEAESHNVSGLTLTAPDRPSNSKRKRISEEPKSKPATKLKKSKVAKSKLPSVQPKKKRPYTKRVGNHAHMMKKYYKTGMSLHDMMGTQTTTDDNISPIDGTNQIDIPMEPTSYVNFTLTIREGMPMMTTLIKNGPHSVSLLQIKSLEPFLPRGTEIFLKSVSQTFTSGWLFDEVVNSFFWC